MRPVIFYPGDDGLRVAECPGFPGCVTQAKTRGDASENIGEAIEGYMRALTADERPVPEQRFDALLLAV